METALLGEGRGDLQEDQIIWLHPLKHIELTQEASQGKKVTLIVDKFYVYINQYGKGKGRDVKEDSVDASWSRPRRERYVTDIPPETQEERRDRSV